MNFVQVITIPLLVTLPLSLVQVVKVHSHLIMNASTSTMRKMPLPGQTRDLGVRASNSAIASHGRCVILDRKCYLIYLIYCLLLWTIEGHFTVTFHTTENAIYI